MTSALLLARPASAFIITDGNGDPYYYGTRLSTGAAIGLSVGLLVLALAITALVWYIYRKRMAQRAAFMRDLEARGVPVPYGYGVAPGPVPMMMPVVPGQVHGVPGMPPQMQTQTQWSVGTSEVGGEKKENL
uniref:Uncharacterized protein n=1 Tax=Mycena chlorophos TaxID=658473 RepID=A0ABQ0L008_MYCCL|nr:predicted protein [Mycena chlorophos]